MCTCSLCLWVYSVVGIIADCWIGWYKVLNASPYFTLLAIILKVIGKEIFYRNYTLHLVVAVLALDGSGCTACVLQFTMDQLVGVSGKNSALLSTG